MPQFRSPSLLFSSAQESSTLTPHTLSPESVCCDGCSGTVWPLLGTGSISHKTQPSTTGGRKAATEKGLHYKDGLHPFPQKWLPHTALRPRLSTEQPLLFPFK